MRSRRSIHLSLENCSRHARYSSRSNVATWIGLRLSIQKGLRTVQAQLTDGQGNTSPQAFLHFELYNCGHNNPQGILCHGVRQRE